MTLTAKQITRRHGAFVAAVTALLLAAAILVQAFLQSFIGLVATLQVPTGQMLATTIGYGLLAAIPFAAGYFLALWLIAPIASGHGVGSVIARALIATGVGAAVLFVVLAVLAVIGAFGIPGPLFSNSLGGYFDSANALNGLGRAFVTALGRLVELLPLGLLAGVLLSVWLRERVPRHPAS